MNIHPKAKGATLGALIAALVCAEATHRLGLKLLPEEVGGIETVSAFLGAFFARRGIAIS